MDPPPALVFPDGPRTELDAALLTLMRSAQRVSETQGRLRGLLQANLLVVEKLDLPTVLRSLVTSAVHLVDARYGALGVMSPDGNLEQFVHVGMPEGLTARIGHLPEGKGLLGAVLAEGAPVRTARLGDDPRSSGFPPGHPDMSSFLGVPIRVRGELFGSLYFAEKRDGDFTDEDEELLGALAASAGIAIDNARLFDETRRRQAWTAASTEIATVLLADDARSPLHLVAERVVDLAEADLVSIVLPASAGTVVVDVARGRLAGDLEGRVLPADATLSGQALHQQRTADATGLSSVLGHGDDPLELGPTIAVPLEAADRVHGVLTVARAPGGPRFTGADVEMITDFARQASLAIAVRQVRLDRHRLEREADRNRIARDLHDHVIQRLYAAGLDLQAAARGELDDETRALLDRHVDTLDSAIAEIRTAIFAISPSRVRGRTALRQRVVALLAELGGLFPTTPRLSFVGPLDLSVPDGLADDAVAVVREGLSNVARHAGAQSAGVSVSVTGRRLEITITDDGVGLPDDRVESGLANLADRARSWQGRLTTRRVDGGGTRVSWTASIPSAPADATVDEVAS